MQKFNEEIIRSRGEEVSRGREIAIHPRKHESNQLALHSKNRQKVQDNRKETEPRKTQSDTLTKRLENNHFKNISTRRWSQNFAGEN